MCICGGESAKMEVRGESANESGSGVKERKNGSRQSGRRERNHEADSARVRAERQTESRVC